jgi:hypothetical protein
MNTITKNTQEDLSGTMSIKLANRQTLDDFCAEYINDYNRNRFEAIAIRLLVGKETIITIYALDKLRQEGSTYNADKIPVKKFKLTDLSAGILFSYCSSLNLTLSTGNYNLEEMEVMNK